jgi:methionyl-tRNA formyltransferase
MDAKLDIVFCGTPRFAVPTLEALVAAGHKVRLVVTQPDRPRGRGMEFAQSPVKQRALELGLEITQPEKIKSNAEFRAKLEQIAPQAIIVVGYGRIIPQWMIDLPPLGNINLHASLLPKYRGAAPIQWAIANGETVTGNTTMHINAGLDTGDILLQEETRIAGDDTAVTLGVRLAASGSELMVKTLRGLQDGKVAPRKQDEAQASLAPVLKKEDGRVDFTRTAKNICDRLRGFQPWPGAFTTFRGKTLAVIEAGASANVAHLLPGEIALGDELLLAGCGDNSMLEILAVQPEGKKRMSARDFTNGYKPLIGERFGEAFGTAQ